MKVIKRICVRSIGRNPDNPSDRKRGNPRKQRLEMNEGREKYINTLTSVQKDNLLLEDKNMDDSKTEYRIRKLTAKECWRLMGFSDEDYEAAEKVNSKTQLYKQAGNAIVENVLVAIFGQMILGCEDVYKDRREVKNEQSSINT